MITHQNHIVSDLLVLPLLFLIAMAAWSATFLTKPLHDR